MPREIKPAAPNAEKEKWERIFDTLKNMSFYGKRFSQKTRKSFAIKDFLLKQKNYFPKKDFGFFSENPFTQKGLCNSHEFFKICEFRLSKVHFQTAEKN